MRALAAAPPAQKMPRPPLVSCAMQQQGVQSPLATALNGFPPVQPAVACLKRNAAWSNWKSTRMLSRTAGPVSDLPNKGMPAPLRGVKPDSGRLLVDASASTCAC